MMWTLKAAAEHYVLNDWSTATKADHEWAEALAVAMDKFARDWIRDNCAGRALKEKYTAIRALKEKP